MIVTKESAIHMAKHVCLHEAENPNLSLMKRMALKTAANGDGLRDIFEKLYSLGFSISADESLPHIQGWIRSGALVEKK